MIQESPMPSWGTSSCYDADVGTTDALSNAISPRFAECMDMRMHPNSHSETHPTRRFLPTPQCPISPKDIFTNHSDCALASSSCRLRVIGPRPYSWAFVFKILTPHTVRSRIGSPARRLRCSEHSSQKSIERNRGRVLACSSSESRYIGECGSRWGL